MSHPAIRAVGLAKRFGTVEALRALDLEVERGEVFGYLGPNGAGKTTTIRPTSGRIEVLGAPAPTPGSDAGSATCPPRSRSTPAGPPRT